MQRNNNNNNNSAPKKKTRRGKRGGQGPKKVLSGIDPRDIGLIMEDEYKKSMRSKVVDQYSKPALISIIDPEVSDEFRWSSSTSVQKTATCTPQLKMAAPFNNTDVDLANSYLPRTDLAIITRRIPQCSHIVFDHNPAGLSKLYQVWFLGEGGALGNNNQISIQGNNVEEPWPVVYGYSTSAYSPHGTKLYAGTDGTEKRFLWVDYGDTYTCVLSTQLATTLTVRWYMFNPFNNQVSLAVQYVSAALGAGGAFDASLLVSTATSPAFSANRGAYFCFTVSSSAAGNNLVGPSGANGLQITGNGRTWAHLASAAYSSNDTIINSMRMIGLSQMYSNRAAEQFRAGSCCAVQVGKAVPWMTFTNYSSVRNNSDSEEFPAFDGLYGFLKPSTDQDLQMTNYTTIQNGTIVDSAWPLRPASDYLITWVTVPLASGRDGVLTFDYTLEYITNNQYAALGRPKLPPSVCAQALFQIGSIPQFYENPLHFKQLMERAKDAARSVGKSIVKYGPKALATGVDAALEYGPKVLMLAQLLSAL